MSFSALGLTPALVRRCEALGYTTPTPIQKRAIPVIFTGADLIGCAETGTGKTAAFLLPLVDRLLAAPRDGVRLLVLAPTRELAAQIAANLRSIDPQERLRCASLIGGENIERQIRDLRRGASVVIATPGRLLDHIERGSVRLSRIEALVLDEADRMLDMGFWPDVRRILANLPSERQTLLFSATMSPAIEAIARQTMRSPQLVEVNTRGRAAATVAQAAYPVAMGSKTALLIHLLESEGYERVLVFTRTRRGAERLSRLLSSRDYPVNRIHADRTQPQRDAALRGFKEGRHRVLVATDIAARGIDVESVSHVINYDVPAAPEDYVHRIGRTGRAGNAGRAITLVTPVEELSMNAIERFTGQSIDRVVLPDFGGIGASASGSTRQVAPFGRRASFGVRSFRPRRAGR